MFYIFYFKVSIKTFKPVSHTLSKISDKKINSISSNLKMWSTYLVHTASIQSVYLSCACNNVPWRSNITSSMSSFSEPSLAAVVWDFSSI